MYSTLGEMEMAPRRCAPGPGRHLKSGSAIQRDVHLAGRSAEFVALHFFQKFAGKLALFEELDEGEAGIDAGGNDVAVDLVAILQNDALSAIVLYQDLCNRRFGADLDANFAGGVGDGVGDCAGAAARKSPGTKRAVNFSHVVMQQDVGRAGRAHAKKRADDSGGRHGGLEHVGFKPLVQEVNGAHGHELDLVVFVVAGQALKAAAEKQHLHQFARIERGRIGRHHAQDRLHEAAHGLHGLAELFVGFGVDFGVAGDLATRLAVIVHAPEIIAVRHGRERAVERQDFQAVAGQIEVADDLRPQAARRHTSRQRT